MDTKRIKVSDGRELYVDVWQERDYCSINVYDVTGKPDGDSLDGECIWSSNDADEIAADVRLGLYNHTPKSIAEYVAQMTGKVGQ